MKERIEACDCPRDDCEGKVSVTLEYEPPDPHYGADADGNRGMYVAGYWDGTAADTCTLGHKLTVAETDVIEYGAVHDAISDPEDEYYGPDSDGREDDQC